VKLDRDPPLLLQVHVIKDLVELHFAWSNGTGALEQAVSKSGFAVVYVGNNAEVAEVLHTLYYAKVRRQVFGTDLPNHIENLDEI